MLNLGRKASREMRGAEQAFVNLILGRYLGAAIFAASITAFQRGISLAT
jgi:hypothetical protein